MNRTHISQNVLSYSTSYSLETFDHSQSITYESKLSQASQINVSYSKDILIPLSIVQNNSSLEAIVVYLKDVLNMRFSEIAKLINRNQRTIWVTYAVSKKKKISLDLNNISGLTLPLSIFMSRDFSILETIVFYLRVNNLLSFNQISKLLGKNYRTIWTVYKRALKKLEHEK